MSQVERPEGKVQKGKTMHTRKEGKARRVEGRRLSQVGPECAQPALAVLGGRRKPQLDP